MRSKGIGEGEGDGGGGGGREIWKRFALATQAVHFQVEQTLGRSSVPLK